MTPKNNAPVEVTLERSSSGTWRVPQSSRRHFKAWHRLWFVTGVIYLLLLAGGYRLLMPTQESIERQMVLSVTEEVKRFDGLAFAGESPQKIFEAARTQGFADWITATRSRYRIGREGDAGFAKIENTFRDSISDLPMKRIAGIFISAIIWLVPMALFFAVGFTIDWIKRGVGGNEG